MPDPSAFVESAKTLFSGISAAAAAIGVWQRYRDTERAAKTFDEEFAIAKASPEARRAAEQLVEIIPHKVVEDLEKRADKCWTGYRRVLGGGFLPDEVDDATDAVKQCVCRELGRIYDLNGDIPDRWRSQWDRYKCADR